MTFSLLSPLLFCKFPNETNEYVACIQLMVMKSTLEMKHFFLHTIMQGYMYIIFNTLFLFFSFFLKHEIWTSNQRWSNLKIALFIYSIFITCLCLVYFLALKTSQGSWFWVGSFIFGPDNWFCHLSLNNERKSSVAKPAQTVKYFVVIFVSCQLLLTTVFINATTFL